MGIYLNPGNDAFRMALNDDIYVDKSGLIEFVNDRIGKRNRFICVSRPRRFGKSMAAEMLAAYYGRNYASDDLFRNLAISKSNSYREHLNRHDVIVINTQKFLRKAGDPKNLGVYIETKVLAEVKKVYGDRIDVDETSLPDALDMIYATDESPDKGFVFIIDEWDCIFRVARDNTEAQKNYLDFLRDLFKDRVYVKVAYMTGILPIKKYGNHSALNDFDEFSMTMPGMFAEYAGFTEEEVQDLCHRYHKDFEEVKKELRQADYCS